MSAAAAASPASSENSWRDVPMPARMRKLPRDHRGFAIPWFVAWIDGQPDFRVIRPGGVVDAVRLNQCWLCGEPLGVHKAFTIGPMCAVNRTTAEPGSHLDCARYAVQACPFLTQPKMHWQEHNLPAGTTAPAGNMICRNPGVTLIWVTRDFKLFRAAREGGGFGELIRVGDPESVEWWSRARPATRAEVEESIASGMPLLREQADRDRDPVAANAELSRMLAAMQPLLPAA